MVSKWEDDAKNKMMLKLESAFNGIWVFYSEEHTKKNDKIYIRVANGT